MAAPQQKTPPFDTIAPKDPTLTGLKRARAPDDEKKPPFQQIGAKHPSSKRARVGDLGGDFRGELKRVAEMVLLLSGMGRMRGGRAPTEVERSVMGEAREVLVRVCGGMAPREVVSREAVRGVIEDLGLNRAKESKLSFRAPPAMSIKDRMQLSKRKMEESQKLALQSGRNSSQLPPAGPGETDKSPGAYVHVAQRFLPDASAQVAASTRGFTTPPMFHANGVQPTLVSRGALNSPFNRDASSIPLAHTEPMHFRVDGRLNVPLAYTEPMHFRVDGRPSVPSYASQFQANLSGGNLPGKATIGASQLQLGAVSRVGLANKVPDPKVEEKPVVGASQMAPSNTRGPNQTISGAAFKIPQAVQQPLQALNLSHDEIATLVQAFLQPSPPVQPSWSPPSTDYMHKILTCQACTGPLNDVTSLLICDACERGTHLKCLPSSVQRGTPQDWHCTHCLMRYHGIPLPTIYGLVANINNVRSVPPKAALAQCSANRKAESSEQKVNHQKASANGNIGPLSGIHVGAGDAHKASTTDVKMS